MHFARLLREAGIPVGPGAVLDALDAREEERRTYAVTTNRDDEPNEETATRARYSRED